MYRTTVDPSILLNVSRSVPFCCVEKLGYSSKVTRMEDGIRKVLGGKSGSVTRSSLAQSDIAGTLPGFAASSRVSCRLD